MLYFEGLAKISFCWIHLFFQLLQLWDENLVYEISSHPAVKRVVALGTLFALELQADGSNAGYARTSSSTSISEKRFLYVYYFLSYVNIELAIYYQIEQTERR